MAAWQGSRGVARLALWPWGILTFIVGIIGLLSPLYTQSSTTSAILTTCGSALISIAGSLLITELILKPLYIKDILNVAGLKYEVYETGLESVQALSLVEWDRFISSGGEIDLAVGDWHILRTGPWARIVSAVKAERTNLRVYLPEGSETLAREIESSWKRNGCGRQGSAIEISSDDSVTPGLIILTASAVAITVADSRNNEDPAVIVFAKSRAGEFYKSAEAEMKRLRDLGLIPNYQSGQ